MYKRRRIIAEKYGLYFFLLLLLYVLQNDPNLFSINGIKPMLALPLAVCVGMMEGEVAGGLFGMMAGLLCDTGSTILFGFQSLIYLAACAAVGLLVIYFMQPSLINSLIFVTVILAARLLLEYFFYFVMWGHADGVLVLLHKMLPVLIYTTVAAFPIYFLTRKIHAIFARKLEDS